MIHDRKRLNYWDASKAFIRLDANIEERLCKGGYDLQIIILWYKYGVGQVLGVFLFLKSAVYS